MRRQKKAIYILTSLAVGVFALATFGLKEERAAASSFPKISGQTFTQEDYKFEGYSIRYDEGTAFGVKDSGNTSLRFKMSISPALYTYLTSTQGATTGTLIYPTAYLDAGDTDGLTVETVGGEKGEVVPFNVDTTAAWSYNQTSEVYQSVAFLKEIPASCYGREVSVRGYLEVDGKYYYTTATEGRSLAYVANEEYNDTQSPFNTEVKAEVKESLLQFAVTVNGAVSKKYYGEKIPAESNIGDQVFVGYRIANSGRLWDVEKTTVYGPVKLTSEYVSAKENYYSKIKGLGNFTIKGKAEGVTTAYVNGKQYACTSMGDSVTVTGLNALTAGEQYIVSIIDEKQKEYRTVFTVVDDILPYSANEEDPDYLQFDFNDGGNQKHTVVSVVDEKGKEIAHTGACLYGISHNPLSTIRQELVTITDSNQDEYVFLLEVYTDVIYNNEDADAFFLGYVAGETVTWEDAIIEQELEGCYALAADVTLSLPIAHTRTKGGMLGLFDGRGHTISWTSDAKIGEVNNSPALFGYNIAGEIRDIGFNFTFTGTYVKSMTILATYATAPVVTMENVYVNIKSEKVMNERDFGTWLWTTRIMTNVLNFKNVVVVNSAVESGLNGAKRLLMGYDRIFQNQAPAEGAQEYLGTNNMLSPSLVKMDNVYFIVKDSILLSAASLSDVGDRGTIYAENNRPEQCKANQGWYKGAFIYHYSEAKTKLTQKVGPWKLTFGENMEMLSASYEG